MSLPSLVSLLPNPSSLAFWDQFSLVYDDSCYSLLKTLQLTLFFLKREKKIFQLIPYQ